MIGERYYGANASTFIGIAVVGVSLVSLLSALATEIAVIEVGGSQSWSVAASIAGLFIGGALIASKETVGGIMAIMLVASLAINGVSVNFKQLLRVVEGAYDGVSTAAQAVKASSAGNANSNGGVGQNVLFEGYTQAEPLSPAAAKECREGKLKWTKSMAGVRACTTGHQWLKNS